MKQPLYLHGTTAEGLAAILKGEEKPNGPWNCCDRDGLTYLWDVAAMLESGDIEETDQAIGRAFEMAQIQAAIKGEDTALYVLAVDLDPDEVELDCSCEGMGNTAVTVPRRLVTRDRIFSVFRCEFSKWDAPFVLAGLVGRDLFADCNVRDDRLLTLAESMKGQHFRDDLLEFEWTACTFDEIFGP